MDYAQQFAGFRPLATKAVPLNGGSVVVRELTGLERDRLHTSGLAQSAPTEFYATVVAMATGQVNEPADVTKAAADYLLGNVSPEDVLTVARAALDLSGLGGTKGGADQAVADALGN